MKFLVDAQLPSKLCEILEAIGADSIHVDSLPEKDETSDREITIYVDAHDLTVVSKDSDFYHSHLSTGQKGYQMFKLKMMQHQHLELIKADTKQAI